MPAKTDIPNEYKSYVGRVFVLRKCHQIPIRFENNVMRMFADRETEIGDHVLVTDEDHSKVKILTRNNKFAWIGKYYLHREIKQKDSLKDRVNFAAVRLLEISEGLSDRDSEIINESANLLKQLSDMIDLDI